jgi:hypothetical protein
MRDEDDVMLAIASLRMITVGEEGVPCHNLLLFRASDRRGTTQPEPPTSNPTDLRNSLSLLCVKSYQRRCSEHARTLTLSLSMKYNYFDDMMRFRIKKYCLYEISSLVCHLFACAVEKQISVFTNQRF